MPSRIVLYLTLFIFQSTPTILHPKKKSQQPEAASTSIKKVVVVFKVLLFNSNSILPVGFWFALTLPECLPLVDQFVSYMASNKLWVGFLKQWLLLTSLPKPIPVEGQIYLLAATVNNTCIVLLVSLGGHKYFVGLQFCYSVLPCWGDRLNRLLWEAQKFRHCFIT